MKSRDPRIDSMTRGVVIGVMIVAYGWFVRLPQGAFAHLMLVGVAFQVLVIVLRKFFPAVAQPGARYAFELVADGITVLTFALSVFSGIPRGDDL